MLLSTSSNVAPRRFESSAGRALSVGKPRHHAAPGVDLLNPLSGKTIVAPRGVAVRAKSADEEEISVSLFSQGSASNKGGERKKVAMPGLKGSAESKSAAAERAAAISSIVGKVLWFQGNLAIVAGLNSDAPIGTKLSFVSGGTGVLLWHRSDHLSLVMVVGGAQSIAVGDGVECKINAVLQVLDDSGPITRKDYEMFMAPTGNSMFGRVSSFLGVDLLNPPAPSDGPSTSSNPPPGFEKSHALLQQQVAIKNRDQISEGLFTGVKGIDVLTPVGRGSSLLVVGPKGVGKSSMVLDAVIGQKDTGVKCVYAAIGRTQESLRALMSKVEEAGCASNTAVIATLQGAPVGEQYAAISAACALGERVRDEGGHSLVVLDTLNPLVDVWEALLTGLASLGREELLQGLIKDSEGKDLDLPSPEEDSEEMVDYQGMLVSGAVAQRRGFFSTLFMRAAKIGSGGGGGSMSLLPIIPGRPATGVSMRVDMSKYQTISEDQKKKIEAVLRAKLEAELSRKAHPDELTTEAVEEFISIADGQIVLQEGSSGHGAYSLNPKLSVTRIGSRAYPKVLEQLAAQIRLDLTQAEDARKFAMNNDSDAAAQKFDNYSTRILAALSQPSGQPVPMEDLVVTLLAIQRGYADATAPNDVPAFLESAIQRVRANAPQAMEEIASLKMLTAASEKAILEALAAA